MARGTKHKNPVDETSGVLLLMPQDDVAAATTAEPANTSPLVLMVQDIRTLFHYVYLLGDVFQPFRTPDPSNELNLSWNNFRYLAWFTLVSTVSFISTLLMVPLSFVLPGAVFLLVACAGIAGLHLLCRPLQGPLITRTSFDISYTFDSSLHQAERWVFINGVATSGHGLQQNVDRLSQIFQREVVGIHNKTYGLLGDIVECIIQRSFRYYTKDTRAAYAYVKAFCADQSIKKVVLIGHSQGGIVVSNIIDQLLTDLPDPNVAKLEVYTFGNAASHFNNPLRRVVDRSSPDASSQQMGAQLLKKDGDVKFSDPRSRTIPHIEHYANGRDLVTRWGVLHNVREIVDNRFCGKVFIHCGQTGHLLNQHYLAQMFPLSQIGHTKKGNGHIVSKDKARDQQILQKAAEVPFLDQIVDIDYELQKKRRRNRKRLLGLADEAGSAARPGNGPVKNGDRLQVDIQPHGLRDELDNLNANDRTADSSKDSSHMLNSKKTVRELSRLCKYMNGRSPED